MTNRRRRAAASSSRPRRFSPVQSSLQRHGSARSYTQVNNPNASHRGTLTSTGPRTLSQRHPSAHSFSGSASVAMHYHTLKLQTVQLKSALEELSASIEELQPEHTAMDWAASAGMVIYVPVRTTRDDQPPRAHLTRPDVRGPERVAFLSMSQHQQRAENGFGFGFGSGGGGSRSVRVGVGQQQIQMQSRSQPPSHVSAWSNLLFGGPLAIDATGAQVATMLPRMPPPSNATGYTDPTTTAAAAASTVLSATRSNQARYAYVEDEMQPDTSMGGT